MVHPLDEYPIHQAPLSMAHVASRRTATPTTAATSTPTAAPATRSCVTGLGIYPNLGVIDAYATVRVGDRQLTVRASDALDGHDRLTPAGRARSASRCIEPLERLRFVCDGDDHGVGLRPHLAGLVPRGRRGAARLALGRPQGHARRPALRPGRAPGRASSASTARPTPSTPTPGSAPATAPGASARSASPSRPGRAADEPIEGFWWIYVPLRFDDFAIVVIVQEDPDGHRVLNDAVRDLAGVGRPPARAAGLAPRSTSTTAPAPATPRAPRSTSPSPTARR